MYEVREIMARRKHKKTGEKVRYLVMEVLDGYVQRATNGTLHATREGAETEIQDTDQKS